MCKSNKFQVFAYTIFIVKSMDFNEKQYLQKKAHVIIIYYHVIYYSSKIIWFDGRKVFALLVRKTYKIIFKIWEIFWTLYFVYNIEHICYIFYTYPHNVFSIIIFSLSVTVCGICLPWVSGRSRLSPADISDIIPKTSKGSFDQMCS